MVLVFLGAWLWLVWRFYRQEGWNAWVVGGIALFPALIWDFFGRPQSFIVENGRLTARWFWGRERSWQLAELTIPEAKRRWFFGSSGYIVIYQRGGGSAFNVAIQLNDFGDFVELIEPGSKKQREPKYNPKSWWNRDLLK